MTALCGTTSIKDIMRKVSLIVVHCSDSDVESHDDISVIDDWHKKRGFLRKNISISAANKTDLHVGYHFFITKKGTIQIGRDLEEIGAHCVNYNSHSIGVCFSGRHEQPNELQVIAAKELLIRLMSVYGLETKDILPHNQLNKGKSCPNFDVQAKLLDNLFQ